MILFPEGICPLCSQVVGLELLHRHIAHELAATRRRTVQVIRAYHPSWLEEQGACEACWKSYRDAGRILSIMKEGHVHSA